MKNKIISGVLVLIFLLGVGLLLYPTVSDWWNQKHSSKMISNYAEQVNTLQSADVSDYFQKAASYNERLYLKESRFSLTEDEIKEYRRLLNPQGDGMMGYVEVPKIRCKLPIYHGTEEESLVNGTGHLEWSSLPVGGENTHCVISGHRGVPSARLFTDIDQLLIGDVFYLHILGKTLSYQVDQIVTVLPEELDNLQIEAGLDLCTLVTCTPYGINTHRLLVRGYRIDNANADNMKMIADAYQISPWIVVAMLGIPVSVIGIVFGFVFSRIHKKRIEEYQILKKISGIKRSKHET